MLVIAEMVSFVKRFHNLLSVLKMLNAQTVQRVVTGKCLNLLFAVVHHGQLLCSSSVFFPLKRRGVEGLIISLLTVEEVEFPPPSIDYFH
jgi:hypothetical protein